MIPAGTRTRIRTVAEEIGYRPDPMLSALARYRQQQKPAEFHGTIAWLVDTSGKTKWHEVPQFQLYHEAAIQRAKHHGYSLDTLDLADKRMTLKRAGSVMESRGIRGVLLCPQPNSNTDLALFPWERVSAVTFGYSVQKPRLHTVAPAQFRAAFHVTHRVLGHGYRRIGYVTTQENDRRTDYNYLGGFLAAREQHRATKLPLFSGGSAAEFSRWLRKHRPDALVVANRGLEKSICDHALIKKQGIGIACTGMGETDRLLAGMVESAERLGEVAIDLLVNLMHHSERGIPPRPQCVLIDGEWRAGRTLPSARGERSDVIKET
jgi:LacI family transcriptional regulator/LacI family repressor for deo operon, udp, cdd, tsx, nupC, and nupG